MQSEHPAVWIVTGLFGIIALAGIFLMTGGILPWNHRKVRGDAALARLRSWKLRGWACLVTGSIAAVGVLTGSPFSPYFMAKKYPWFSLIMTVLLGLSVVFAIELLFRSFRQESKGIWEERREINWWDELKN